MRVYEVMRKRASDGQTTKVATISDESKRKFLTVKAGCKPRTAVVLDHLACMAAICALPVRVEVTMVWSSLSTCGTSVETRRREHAMHRAGEHLEDRLRHVAQPQIA